ncbi:MAG: hypothetical protein WBP45_01030 [Daejeonella sp.]
MLKIVLHPEDPYIKESANQVNDFYPDLWYQLDNCIELIGDDGSRKLLSFALDHFGCSHSSNIEIGRYIIYYMPREWILTNIHDLVKEHPELDDSWMFLRTLEMYALLDSDKLLDKLLKSGRENSSAAILEIIEDYQDIELFKKSVQSFYTE